MIGGWLLRIVIGLVLAAFIVVEGGSPLLTKATLDGTAHDAADDAAHDYFQNHDVGRAQAVAQQDAENDHAKLEKFDIDQQGTGAVTVKLSKQARSYVLHNLGPTKDWYNVRLSATAVPK